MRRPLGTSMRTPHTSPATTTLPKMALPSTHHSKFDGYFYVSNTLRASFYKGILFGGHNPNATNGTTAHTPIFFKASYFQSLCLVKYSENRSTKMCANPG